MLTVQKNIKSKTYVESQIIELLQAKGTEYNLNSVNNYGDNLLHIATSNCCYEITRKLLEQAKAHTIKDRKNNFGWTPLMLAIRNRDINTVKLFLENGSKVNESTYLGMSVLGLASAINIEMFEMVYNACPSALTNATHDDITPLCVAALKNDKELFFKLLSLGCDVGKENEFTHIIMKQSTIAEIAALAHPQLNIENYWNDTSDNIRIKTDSQEENDHEDLELMTNRNIINYTAETLQNLMKKENNKNGSENMLEKSQTSVPKIAIDSCDDKQIKKSDVSTKPPNLKLLSEAEQSVNQSLISPTLMYNQDTTFPASPNYSFVHNMFPPELNTIHEESVKNQKLISTKSINNNSPLPTTSDVNSRGVLQRLQSIRPLDLKIVDSKNDLNNTLNFTPEFNATRSPNVPSDFDEENAYGEDTPTPPRYKTPPRGMVLSSQQTKMITLLKRFGLTHLVSIFIQQEVDLDLFLTLNETDLIEIGIENQSDRQVLLAMIKLCDDMELK